VSTSDGQGMDRAQSLALLEVANLTPALVVTDHCLKAAGVRLLGIESTDSADQCIKLVGETGAVMAAGQAGVELARQMGSRATLSVLPAPVEATRILAHPTPVYSPMLDLYDYRIPKDSEMSPSDAVGLLETQGLVAALHATDDMLKSSNVTLVGKKSGPPT
jgi:ethanolamine utilization protein EutM